MDKLSDWSQGKRRLGGCWGFAIHMEKETETHSEEMGRAEQPWELLVKKSQAFPPFVLPPPSVPFLISLVLHTPLTWTSGSLQTPGCANSLAKCLFRVFRKLKALLAFVCLFVRKTNTRQSPGVKRKLKIKTLNTFLIYVYICLFLKRWPSIC